MMSSTITLILLNHDLKYIHHLLHEKFLYTKLVMFVAIFFQDLINALSNVIDYTCMVYMLI